MPIRRRLPLWLLAAALLAAGCISHKGAARPETPAVTSPTTDASPSYYTANFTCSAEGMTANGQLRMQTDSIIWLSASKVIELGRARFTHDSVIIHAKITGQCFRGDYNDLYRRFNFRTDFDQLSKTLTAPAPQGKQYVITPPSPRGAAPEPPPAPATHREDTSGLWSQCPWGMAEEARR